MIPRKFTVGDQVRLIGDFYSSINPQDVYTISRILPAQEYVRQYRVKRVSDGQERAVSESQLVKMGAEEQSGRTEIEAQRELQRVRNLNALGRTRSAAKRGDRR
jgi:hypothetical protein